MIVLIGGKKRAGKNYVAENLLRLKPGYKIMAFADILKDIVCKTFDLDRRKLEGLKNLESKISYRDGNRYVQFTNFRLILQRLGTNALRPLLGDDIFAKLTYAEIKRQGFKDIIISDFRFKSEYEYMCTQDNVLTINVLGGVSDNHPSEHDLDDFSFDCVIDNKAKGDISYQVKEVSQKL